MKEMDLKIKLVEHLLKFSSSYDQIVNSEYSFQFGSRRADIVSISGDMATVFEIKSERDNTEKLVAQIEDYKKYFDFCYVVCERSNLKSVREKAPLNIGIIIIDTEIHYIRKAKQIKRLNKLSLTSTLSTKTLNKISSESYSDKFSKCLQASKENTSKFLRITSRKEMRNNVYSIYSQFLEDIGDVITADDIYQLSRAPAGDIVVSHQSALLNSTLEVIK
jgi:hypothetical protein